MSALQTRESSTLVIVTFLASASLLLLTLPSHNTTTIYDIAPLGFFFALIGLLYRQATAWTISRIAYNREVECNRENNPCRDRERGEDARFWRNHTLAYYLYSGIREFLVIWFISIPIVLWGTVWGYKVLIITSDVVVFVIEYSMLVGFFITVTELGLRAYDRSRHR